MASILSIMCMDRHTEAEKQVLLHVHIQEAPYSLPYVDMLSAACT